ncbi:UNVERIFIED_CONTAM: putative O-methyltransferase 3 [Sesamum calycinum]|uniref:O-methyltransferase 3 n=1 Tax=Sesamum calycinum TaxID=2727403 RepID=A0AAW2RBD9_9LAMI
MAMSPLEKGATAVQIQGAVTHFTRPPPMPDPTRDERWKMVGSKGEAGEETQEEWFQTLKKCKEALTRNERGKVIIIEKVVVDHKSDHKSVETQFYFDMLVMTVVGGKERKEKERAKLFTDVGFSSYRITTLLGLRSIIEDITIPKYSKGRFELYSKEKASSGIQASAFTCGIRLESKPSCQKFEHTNNYFAHEFCMSCVTRHIQAKLEGNISTINCPELTCDQTLDPVDCQAMIPPRLFIQWCDCLCRSVVSGSEKCYCPYMDCSEMILNECYETVKRCLCPGCFSAMLVGFCGTLDIGAARAIKLGISPRRDSGFSWRR